MSEIAAAVEALVRWSRTEDDAALPESALGLLDIAATGLADLGVTLPSPVDGPSGTWMGAYFAAVAKAARLEVIASDSARTRAMTHLARTEGVYHASALERIVGGGPDRAAAAWSGPARSAMRVSLCEFVAHLAQGFALHGRTPHCGPAGRSLLQGAIDFAGPGHFVPPVPPYRYVGDETAVVTLHFGQPMFVDLADDSVSPEVIQTGWWEPWIDGVVQKSVGRGDVAINVGANLGYHTLLIANCVQDAGRVFAFEPNPRLLRRFVRSIKWAGLRETVMVLPFAAADKVGRSVITFTKEMSGHGGFFETSDAVWRPRPSPGGMSESDKRAVATLMSPQAASIEVDVSTLDASLGKQIDSAHLLLIDAEQAEPMILEGGMDLIRRSRDLTIMMEWMNGPTIAPSAEMRKRAIKVIDQLADDGFKFWNIDADRRDIFARPAALEPMSVDQVLAIDAKADLFLRRR